MAMMALTLGLDLGDAGGYLKMTTNNMYVDMKKQLDDELVKVLKTKRGNDPGLTDDQLPAILGPWSKMAIMTLEEQNKIYDAGLQKLILANDKIFDKMNATINQDIINNIITQKQLEDDVALQNTYFKNNVDSELLLQKILDDYCIINNGKIILRKSGRECSYKDKESCHNSYNWPMRQEPNEEVSPDKYGEFKSNMLNGICILSNPSLRTICDLNKLNYNTEDGLCRVTKEYCLMKGADWNEEHKDCHISKGQDIAELIFGTTIVRGLKQIFDPKQYEPCKEGEIDDGYFCRKIACNEGDEQWKNAGLCYPVCKPGYEPLVANFCEPKTHGVPGATMRDSCRSNSYGTTAGMCRNNCPGDTSDVGGVCWYGCGGDVDAGALCRRTCAAGYRDVAGVCWKDCPEGYADDGAFCRKDAHIYGKGCCCAEACAYGKCSDNGCCRDRCPSDYSEDPCTCRKDAHIFPKDSYVPDTYPKRSFVSESFPASCPSNKQDIAALCYDKCQPGYSMKSAGICKFDGTTYGRGAGYPAVKIRAKKRIIPFSTKDN
jgi:hypothetical protein